MASGFVALLIAFLGLEITGFLGLSTTDEHLGNDIAQGLACLLVIYFFITFLFHIFIDYSAWTFKCERQQTQPYLGLIQTLESNARVTAEQIENACSGIESLHFEDSMQSGVAVRELLDSAVGQLRSIDKHSTELLDEARPLFTSWGETIRGMDRLSARLWARFISLWMLDILIPVSLGIAAIYSTHSGLTAVAEKITS